MARVLPRDVAKMIEDAFPWVVSGKSGLAGLMTGPPLAALIDLVEKVPDGMLQSTSEKYRNFVWAVSSLRYLAKMLETGQTSAAGGLAWPSVGPINAVSVVWLFLKECPDEVVAESTPSLTFLKDEDFRLSVQIDISSAEADFDNGEWKSATVMAGSALEALLLWTVSRFSENQRRTAMEKCGLGNLDAQRPEAWRGLDDYIKVARELRAISEDTAKQASLARNFRNLIHPGREMRKSMKCDRGTARSALASVDHVVRDIENNAISALS
jgi:hypothetical protein